MFDQPNELSEHFSELGNKLFPSKAGSIRLIILVVLEAKPGANETPNLGSTFARLVKPSIGNLSLPCLQITYINP